MARIETRREISMGLARGMTFLVSMLLCLIAASERWVEGEGAGAAESVSMEGRFVLAERQRRLYQRVLDLL